MPCQGKSCGGGPGYKSPLDAMKNGPKEKILYVPCIQPEGVKATKPDYLATIDVDPKSPTYCQVIHRLHMPVAGDELHHSGWNVCSSCHDDPNLKRDHLVLPGFGSDRIYFVDVSNPTAPKHDMIVEPEEMHKFGVSTPHTAHCLPSGHVMMSTLGDTKGEGLGEFVLIDAKTAKVSGLWTKGKQAKFGYDFWYQPYFDVMLSSEWGAPRCFMNGHEEQYIYNKDTYGRSVNVFSWSEHRLLQTIDLGEEGVAPLEIRFLHNPLKPIAFVGCAVNANVFRITRKEDGTWFAENAIDVPAKKVEGWAGSEMQGMITDILISLDDRFLYFSNFLHGDVRQYDISDPFNPRLTGQVFLGGSIYKGGPVKVIEDKELKEQPEFTHIKGRPLHGSPQMLQLSLDGKRLYVSSALFSPYDRQFYPEHIKNGSFIVQLDVDVENGGMKINPDFLVDFGLEPEGPVLAHEMRYPGGDCTSDIWLDNGDKQ
ncbi:hypothetical protein FOCC_FOCC000343 [Frankliniella occidentalis]|uniref:Methanethiol oxidase n=1 Tax=Frankliniella occidentalis TaxID=133901 RepID=A0A6J1S9J4_FRAOC|nr:methanethiol oxidase [Frankliniella occidentalis]KAE8752997.1 hypothetical protein FOCC_FOCC000343 [Frankliniella occidentalis]